MDNLLSVNIFDQYWIIFLSDFMNLPQNSGFSFFYHNFVFDHILHLCVFPLDIFVWHSSSVPFQMYHKLVFPRGCIVTLVTFFSFLHCAFSYVSSNGLSERMHSCIRCICLAFLHCVFSTVPSKLLHKKIVFLWLFSAVDFQMCTYNRLSQTDNRLSVNNIKYIITLRERNLPTTFIF